MPRVYVLSLTRIQSTSDVEAAEVNDLIAAGSIPLQDVSTCNDSLGTDPDPYMYAMCQMSIAIAEDPSGPAATTYNAAMADIASGNYGSTNIPWYVPTRQIKTFHPRSPGMVAYMHAIVDAMIDEGQL